jgi:hypothetical protein
LGLVERSETLGIRQEVETEKCVKSKLMDLDVTAVDREMREGEVTSGQLGPKNK